MLPFKVEAVVACDDIRQEQNNKHILIGVYGGTIVVQGFPAEMALCWWIQVTPEKAGDFHLELLLTKNESDILIRAALGFSVLKVEPGSIALPKAPLHFSGPGRLQLKLKLKDDTDWQIIQEIDLKQGSVALVQTTNIVRN